MDLSWTEAASLVAQVVMGMSLAACAGLRAFLPMLVVGLAGRFDLVPLSGSFAWLEGWPAITVFSVAVVLELLGDKFPGVDHFLDVVQTGAKPVAGTLLVACVVTELSPLQSTVLGIVVGGTTAGAVHLVKAKARVLSTATTAGLGNPVVSTLEDVGAFFGSIGAIFVPFVVFALFLIGFVLLFLTLRQLARNRNAVPASVIRVD